MIVGLGIDVAAVPRVARMLERHGGRLLARCFLPEEPRRPADPEHVAGLLAAKEAAFKALGTGWSEGIGWRDVVVVPSPQGGPALDLRGAALARAEQLGARRWHVSITHTAGIAAAVVVLES